MSLFPILCAVLGEHWDFGWPAGAFTGILWGPFGPLALWTANQPRLYPCEECGNLIPLAEMTCRYCGTEYYDDEEVVDHAPRTRPTPAG